MFVPMDPAADNPAVTVPATHAISSYEQNFQSLSAGSAIVQRQSCPQGSSGTDSIDDVRVETNRTKPPTERPKETHTKPSKYDVGWRRVVRNFTPSWFSMTMGTGVVSILFITIPYKAEWLYWLSVVFFGLNTILFALAFSVSFLRYGLYPEIWTVMIQDPTNSLFLGTAPMGFATLVESFVSLCCPYWGEWSTILAWVLWMVDSVAAFAVTASLSFILISQSHIRSLVSEIPLSYSYDQHELSERVNVSFL